MIKRIHGIGQKPKEDYIYKLMEFDIKWLLLTSNTTERNTSAELVFEQKNTNQLTTLDTQDFVLKQENNF
jgi:hypothetical protein